MMKNQHDDAEIRALIARWSKAVRDQDLSGIRADHDPEILMFDVPPPFLSRGLDAYMATWDEFLGMQAKPVQFDFRDIAVTAGTDLHFSDHLRSSAIIWSLGAAAPTTDRERWANRSGNTHCFRVGERRRGNVRHRHYRKGRSSLTLLIAQPAVESVEELSDLGSLVVMTPSPQHRIQFRLPLAAMRTVGTAQGRWKLTYGFI